MAKVQSRGFTVLSHVVQHTEDNRVVTDLETAVPLAVTCLRAHPADEDRAWRSFISYL